MSEENRSAHDAGVEKTKAKLDEWNAQIDKRQARVDAAQEDDGTPMTQGSPLQFRKIVRFAACAGKLRPMRVATAATRMGMRDLSHPRSARSSRLRNAAPRPAQSGIDARRRNPCCPLWPGGHIATLDTPSEQLMTASRVGAWRDRTPSGFAQSFRCLLRFATVCPARPR